MKTIEINLYKFEELPEETQQKVIENNIDINVDFEWWDCMYEDAESIGLKLTGFDIYRGNYCQGHFIYGAVECANLIMTNHGEGCETFETASDFMKQRDNLVYKYSDKINTEIVSEENEYDFDLECDELEEDFLNDILEDYRILLSQEYEYRTSEEAVKETIICNEYDFTEDGEIY